MPSYATREQHAAARQCILAIRAMTRYKTCEARLRQQALVLTHALLLAERLAETTGPDGTTNGLQRTELSEYYIETEGMLQAEFGAFLAKFADRIDGAVAAAAAAQNDA